MTVVQLSGYLKGSTGSPHPGTTAERNLQTAAGKARGNREADFTEEWMRKLWYPNYARSISPASGNGRFCSGGGTQRFPITATVFDRGRSAHQAVAQAQQYLAEGYGWVVDLDSGEIFSIESITTN